MATPTVPDKRHMTRQERFEYLLVKEDITPAELEELNSVIALTDKAKRILYENAPNPDGFVN